MRVLKYGSLSDQPFYLSTAGTLVVQGPSATCERSLILTSKLEMWLTGTSGRHRCHSRWMSRFPTFSPRYRPAMASGADSMPCNTSSTYFIEPFRTQAARSVRALGA